MNTYIVNWAIEIEADSPEVAAQEAYAIMLDGENIPPTFSVTSKDGVVEIDLAD